VAETASTQAQRTMLLQLKHYVNVMMIQFVFR
jgi:hypothetical protein